LIVTIISFFTYYNMVNMSRNWIGSGQISFTSMLLSLHLPVFLAACVMLFWRQRQGLIFYKTRPFMKSTTVNRA
jgi:lipopolysaccharide export LptBFGC system permease protein LptF